MAPWLLLYRLLSRCRHSDIKNSAVVDKLRNARDGTGSPGHESAILVWSGRVRSGHRSVCQTWCLTRFWVLTCTFIVSFKTKDSDNLLFSCLLISVSYVIASLAVVKMQSRNRLGDIAEKLGFLTGNWHYIKPLSRICFTALNYRVGSGHGLKILTRFQLWATLLPHHLDLFIFTNKHVYKLTMAAIETDSARDQPKSLNYWLVTNMTFH